MYFYTKYIYVVFKANQQDKNVITKRTIMEKEEKVDKEIRGK